jgi:hypothetical protein
VVVDDLERRGVESFAEIEPRTIRKLTTDHGHCEFRIASDVHLCESGPAGNAHWNAHHRVALCYWIFQLQSMRFQLFQDKETVSKAFRAILVGKGTQHFASIMQNLHYEIQLRMELDHSKTLSGACSGSTTIKNLHRLHDS